MVYLSIVNPGHLCESFGLNDNIVTDDEFDGDSFYELIDTGWIVGLKEGGEVSCA